MKKIIITGLTIVLSISLLTGCGKKNNTQPSDNQNNQETKNPNDSIQRIQTIGKLKFEIKSLKSKNNISTLEYLIINESTEDYTIPKYKMTVSNGEDIIYTLNMSHKNNLLNPNQTKLIKKEINHDLTKATSIIFELIEE